MGNALEYAVGVAQDVIVPEAEDAVTLRFEEEGAHTVVGSPRRVLPAIDFDDQLGRVAGEVGDIRPERDLLAPVTVREGFDAERARGRARIWSSAFAADVPGR